MTAIAEAPRVADPLRIAIQLTSPVEGKFEGFIRENVATKPLRVVKEGMFAGKTLALCGAGPSLKDETIRGADEIFACNSALPYLIAQGVKVTGGVGIDQTPGLLREWSDPPDVPYFLASSCDPSLVAYLVAHGRKVRFFHNAVGLPDELAFYGATWPPTYMVGEGLTVVSRFIGLAFYMGFERVDVYGADCAFGEDHIVHANGELANEAYTNPLIMRGVLPPSIREWRTRPDMLRDAVHLVNRVRQFPGRVRLIGDTLPVALLGKDDAYLNNVCRTLQPGELPPTHTPSES
jgi:hypothetical protein